MHTATHKEEHKEDSQMHKVQSKRTWAAGAIAVGALITGANSVHALLDQQEEPLNISALSVELGAVAINAGLYNAIRKRNDGTLAQKDALRHHGVDGAIATMTAASIAVNPYFVYADGLGGLVATAASSWLAYQTYTNQGHEDD